MKKILFTLLLFACYLGATAQPDCTLIAVRNLLLDDAMPELKDEQYKADIAPAFVGGIDSLQSYFSANALTDPAAANMVFRVHIAFTVHCNGDIGDFKIISNGQGQLRVLAEQVLEIAKNMPKKWSIGSKNGQKHDCVQVLSFTVMQGKIKVSYKS